MFEVTCLDVGVIEKVIIGHSTEGRGLGWFCNQVTIKDGPDAEIAQVFPCQWWVFYLLECSNSIRIPFQCIVRLTL